MLSAGKGSVRSAVRPMGVKEGFTCEGVGQGARQREFLAMGAGLLTDIAEEFPASRKGPGNRAL